MPMSGGGNDWMSLLGDEQQDGQKPVSKNWWQQPAQPYEQARIAPLSMQQQGGEQEAPPGWSFLRNYLGQR